MDRQAKPTQPASTESIGRERVDLSAAMFALAVVTAVATAVVLREVIRDLGDRS
jgi:hypothetical protein